VPDVDEQHLRPDDGEDQRQTVGEVDEAVHHPGEQEVEGAQPEHGEGVGREDDERLGGHGEDRRDRVDREDQVGRGDHDEDDDQRLGPQPPGQQPQRAIALGRHLLAFAAHELPGGEEQHGAEDVEGGVERVEQRGAGDDEHQPQHERERDAPGEHLGLRGGGHREVGEDHGEDEEVVERQRALEQVAGEELAAGLVALPRPEGGAEAHGDDQPDDRPGRRLAHPRGVVAGEDQQVDREHPGHQRAEDAPGGKGRVEVERGGRRCGDGHGGRHGLLLGSSDPGEGLVRREADDAGPGGRVDERHPSGLLPFGAHDSGAGRAPPGVH
jgi:hypothetical protein